ncbi:MAG: tetratricopeptide repeat protein [Agriterribacter sp.]
MSRLMLLWIICLLPVAGTGQITSATDARKETDSLETVIQLWKGDKSYIDAGIKLAGRYMDFSRPGKAQEILERMLPLADSLAYDKGSYFTRSYLAEIFFQSALYDNALYMLKRAAAFAHKLNDNELTADSWNIMGLIYQEMQVPDSALACFRTSLALMPEHKKNTLESSYRYQVLSNLGQVLLQTEETDSAAHYLETALQEATALQAYRGMSIAKYYLGTIMEKRGSAHTAMEYYRTAILYAHTIDDKDVIAFIYPSIVSAMLTLKAGGVNDSLQVYDAFVRQYEDRISFSTQKEYYSSMMEILHKQQNEKSFWYQQQLNNITTKINKEALQKRLPVLSNLVNNEKRLATLEQEKIIQTQQLQLNRNLLLFMIVLLLLLCMVLAFVIKNRKQKQQLAVQEMKNDISAALHDEVAASLTGINLFGRLAEDELKDQPGNAGMYAKKMRLHAESLAGYIADIVWIIDPGHRKGEAIVNKLDAYGKQPGQHAVSIVSNGDFTGNTFSMQMRKDLYLLGKRLLQCACTEATGEEIILGLLREGNAIILKLYMDHDPEPVMDDDIVKNKMEVLQGVYSITNNSYGYELKLIVCQT